MDNITADLAVGTAELQQLIATLSDFECARIARLLRDVVAGDRVWEDDPAILYNENVKIRHSAGQIMTSTPSLVETEDRQGPFAPVPVARNYRGKHSIPLPPVQPLQAPLEDCLTRRRTYRPEQPFAVGLEPLSSLLANSFGTTGHVSAYGYAGTSLRPFPSTGGLQSPEVYLAVRAVSGLEQGVYHYEASNHRLEVLKVGDFSTGLMQACFGQHWVKNASVVVLLTGVYERLRWKYGPRGFKYMCMDVGCATQTLYLCAQALNLGVCAIAGFSETYVEDLLGIDGLDEIALLLLTISARESTEGS